MKDKQDVKTNNSSSEIKSFFYIIILALIFRALVMELFVVPTGSMKLNILEGDYILSTKYSYGYSNHSLPFSPNLFSGRILASEPQRGDIVIFRPPVNMDMRYIKRLIGLPGDKVQLINDVVYINDKPVAREEAGEVVGEDGLTYRRYKETLPNGKSYFAYKFTNESCSTEPFYVPQDHFFFVGDNRDDSGDSRTILGYVPFENFIAKGRFVIFSTKQWLWVDSANVSQNLMQIWGRILPWFSSIRVNRIFEVL